MGILDDLVEGIPLLPEDRDRMLARGFDDKTIEARRWKSCHPNNARVVHELMDKYGVEPCLQTGIIEKDPSDVTGWVPNRQLLEPNILIAYQTAEGTIEKVRPHKLGFKGQPSLVYRGISSYNTSSTCIIAESEFKADAAECFGYAAIGIPGIMSMSGKNWDYFSSVIKTIRTQEFVILFDNEVKDNPALSNYKADWRRRYDTTIYAYAMCQKILNLGLHCRVGILPASWMVDGKIDIDMALAQKRKSYEFKQVIDDAPGPKGFLKLAPIPQGHMSYVQRRIRSFFSDTNIEIINNCFYISTGVDKNSPELKPKKKKLSNCHIRIQNVYEEIGTENTGVRRDIVIIDEYGIEGSPTPINPNSMVSKSAFNTWLMSQGNYIFFGADADVTALWEYVFDHDEGDIVYLVDRCGYIREHGFYLFKNVLIKNGEAIKPDENGVFWVDSVGYKANKISDDEVVPSLSTTGTFDVNAFIQYMSDTLDIMTPGLGKAAFAWILAVLFLEQIQKKYKMFPLLFLYGNRGSGKTTIMRWMTAFFGQENATKALAASSTVGVSRLLSYFAGLPLVVDDWRDDIKSRSFITLFLGVYNRQMGAKGVKTKFGLQQTDVRAALAIMGEEMISDNGLASRCVSFFIPTARKEERYDEMESIISNASKFMYDTLTTNYMEKCSRVVGRIDEAVQILKGTTDKLEQRLAFNYGILLGSYEAIMGPDEELRDYFKGKIRSAQAEISQGDKIHRFAEEFLFGVSQHLISTSHYKFSYDNHVFLWLKGIGDVMNKYYNRNVDSAPILLKHFSQQKFFVREVRTSLKGKSGRYPCVELDLATMPESLSNFFEGAKSHVGENTQEEG